MTIGSLLQRGVDWGIRHLVDIERIAGVEFCDLTRNDDGAIRTNIRSAIGLLDERGGEHGILVREEIRLLVASSFKDFVLPEVRLCFSRFRGRARSNPLYLATHLVGIAAYLRKREDPLRSGIRENHGESWRKSAQRQLEFLDLIGEEVDWRDGLVRRANQESTEM